VIAQCKYCRAPFWRYRRDHPPAGFCSLPCHDERRKPKLEPPPPEPHVVIRRMREHNRLIHNVDSPLLEWDCASCRKLEAEYAASIDYHSQRLAREMVTAGGMS
jgi:hypothetical protein